VRLGAVLTPHRRRAKPPATRASFSDALVPLTCAECGREQRPGERGWRAYLTTDEEEPAEALTYCPECAESEFSEDSQAAPVYLSCRVIWIRGPSTKKRAETQTVKALLATTRERPRPSEQLRQAATSREATEPHASCHVISIRGPKTTRRGVEPGASQSPGSRLDLDHGSF
jgi:hypothetical protein